MSYYIEYVSYNTTGIKTITSGFQPDRLRITYGARFGTTETNAMRWSEGIVDGVGTSFYNSTFIDSTGKQQKNGGAAASGKIVSVWDRVSGTLTEVIAGTFDSFIATGAKINYSATTNVWQACVELAA